MVLEEKSDNHSYPSVNYASYNNDWLDKTHSLGQCIMNISNQKFLIGFKSHSTKLNLYQASLSGQELFDRQIIVTRGKAYDFFLLNGHSNKLIPNRLSLYPQINVSLNPHQKSSIFSRWQLTQRPTTGQGTENKRLKNVLPQWETSTSNFQGFLQKEGKEEHKSQRQRMTTRKQCEVNTAMQLHM